MSTSQKKKSQPSRKGKKAWRKNVDIQDVEQQLEQLRTEEIVGGIRAHRQNDNDLFVIDRAPTEEVKKLHKLRPLTIDQILKPHSKLPAIVSRRGPSSTLKVVVENGRKSRALSKVQQRLIKKAAERIAKKKDMHDGNHSTGVWEVDRRNKAGVKASSGMADLWNVTLDEQEALVASLDPKMREFVEHALAKKPKRPKLPVHTTPVPAVVPSHPGNSYNPTFDDHQKALKLAADQEIAKIESREAAEKKLSYPKELDDLDDEMFFMNESDGESEKDEGVEEGSIRHTKAVTAEARKTKSQRNKEARRREKLRQEQQEREQRQLLKQINQAESLLKEVEAKNTEKDADDEGREKQKHRPKRLGPKLFEPAPMEIQLTDELADSLRSLKPEGNAFMDRFKSLQERTLIEPRVPQGKRRRYKPKIVESHDYKRFQ
ncbi:ribosome biogenesis protein Nop53/GLTSCR2 [Cladochytrium replicatum]|nr:ribosome biogenesis protein Nop53/GLTSCR2 [Cladochytrium replicatum]